MNAAKVFGKNELYAWVFVVLITSFLLVINITKEINYAKHNHITNHLLEIEQLQNSFEKVIALNHIGNAKNFSDISMASKQLQAELIYFIEYIKNNSASDNDIGYLIFEKYLDDISKQELLIDEYKRNSLYLNDLLNDFSDTTDAILKSDKADNSLKAFTIKLLKYYIDYSKSGFQPGNKIDIKNISDDKVRELTDKMIFQFKLIIDKSNLDKELHKDILNLNQNNIIKNLSTTYQEYFNRKLSKSIAYRYYFYMLVVFLMSIIFFMTIRHRRIAQNLQTTINDLKLQKFALDQHAIISIADTEGNITYANEKFCEISGYTLNEMIGKNHRMLKSKQHSQEFFNNLWGTISKGDVWHGDICNQSKSGENYWLASTIVPISEKDGKPFQYISIRTDISKRKQIELDLQEQQKRISAISQAQALFIANKDPVMFFSNLLPEILSFTDSKFGFIGEMLTDENNKPYLKIYAAIDVAWDKESRKIYEESAAQGTGLYSLDNLFGHVIISGKVVLSNDPSQDPRSKGLPKGHPPLNAFLGIPIYLGQNLQGMIGLANREGGYDYKTVEFLQPIKRLAKS